MSKIVRMPSELTAENGAKAIFMGEYHVTVNQPCDECSREYGCDGAPECDCEDGYVELSHPISWNLIKIIYKRAVKELQIKE